MFLLEATPYVTGDFLKEQIISSVHDRREAAASQKESSWEFQDEFESVDSSMGDRRIVEPGSILESRSKLYVSFS